MAVGARAKSAPAKNGKRSKPYQLMEGDRIDHRDQHMKLLSLRLPIDLAMKMEKRLEALYGRVSRNTYIVEALAEKVARDEDSKVARKASASA